MTYKNILIALKHYFLFICEKKMETVIFKNNSKDDKLLLNIGMKIKTLREAKGIKKGKLSKLSKISYGSLTSIELGLVDIDISTLNKLAQILKVDLKLFLP
jgi:ribosome-binding protein aMBF1 (putative translation factor)